MPEDAAPIPLGVDPREFNKWAVFEAIGYEPDPWQRLFHESAAKHRILSCGVRVGKTFCLAAETVAAVLCPSLKSLEKNEWVGARVWVVAPTYELSDKLFLLASLYIRRHFPMFVVSYSERDRILKTIGGGFLQGKSADNVKSLSGEELDAAILDEAAKMGEAEKEEVRQRLLTRRGWFAAISSPVACRWFERDFVLGQGMGYHYEFEGTPLPGARFAGMKVKFVPGVGDPEPEYFSLTVPTHANERIAAEDLLDAEKTTSDRIFRQNFLAEFMGREGQVFSGYERLSDSERVLKAEPGHRYIIGWDVARAKDYSVVSVMDYDGKRQVFMDRFQGPWDYQIARVIGICRRYNRPDIVVDATGKGDPIAEELKRRNNQYSAWAVHKVGEVPTTAAMLPPDWRDGPFAQRVEGLQINNNQIKRDIVERLAVGIDQGQLRLLPDPVQAQELRLYEFKQSDSTGIVRYGAPPGFHDDCVMSLALAYWRATRPMGTARFLFG